MGRSGTVDLRDSRWQVPHIAQPGRVPAAQMLHVPGPGGGTATHQHAGGGHRPAASPCTRDHRAEGTDAPDGSVSWHRNLAQ